MEILAEAQLSKEYKRRCNQCDQIGRCFNVLGDKLYLKVAQMFGDFGGISKHLF